MSSDWIRLLVKYKGKCAECGKEIPSGEYALWSRASKAIKHVKCETTPAAKEAGETKKQVPEVDCYICGKPAGCAECGFEADCSRENLKACICSPCLEDKKAYENYQQAFLEKTKKIKVKM